MLANFRGRFLVALLFTFFSLCPSVLGRGTDVTFRGTVTRVEQTSGGGTVTVRLVGFDVAVKVTGETDIESHGDAVGLTGIRVGDFVKVSGFFSASGIVAKEIQILDAQEGEFRLRGMITKVSTSAAGTTITVLGVDVLVDANTKIEKRGPEGGFSALNLMVGMQVDVRGTEKNGKLVATRVKAGNREEDVVQVRFEGVIKKMDAGRLMVDTEGGGMAVVLITSSTKIKGTLAVGKFVEVKGTLNDKLEVVADSIKVDGEGDGDRGEGEAKFKKEIKLSPVSSGTELKGNAEIELEKEDGRTQQKFEVEIEKAKPNTEYRLKVEISSSGMVDFGTFTTDREGKAEVKFASPPKDEARDLSKFLPVGKDVRDFKKVQISDKDGKVVLEGSF